MGDFLGTVYQLLTSDTGNLTYHLVLAFSVAAALQSANNQRGADPSGAGRLTVGLAILLVLRLVLFAGAGLAWQGILDLQSWLPMFDRALTLFSLVLILWLWSFPQPSRLADAATLLLALVVITGVALAMVWWIGSGSELPLNGSLLDRAAGVLALLLCLAGGLLLLVRRPVAWGYGFWMFVLLGLGHAVHLVLPLPAGDYGGALRLAQMAAYPLLLALPGRLGVGQAPVGQRQPVEKSEPLPADLNLMKAAYLLTSSDTRVAKAQSICQAVARSMENLEVCLLVEGSSPDGQILVWGGYDAHADTVIPEAKLAGLTAPVLASALSQHRVLRLPASSSSPDLVSLAQLLHLPRSGALLVLPFAAEATGAEPVPQNQPSNLAFVLLSPYSGRGWGAAEQGRVLNTAQPLVRFLHQDQQFAMLQSQLTLAQSRLQASQDMNSLAQPNFPRLLSPEMETYPSPTPGGVQLVVGEVGDENPSELAARLAQENEELKEALQSLMHTPPPSNEAPDGQMRLLLEELAVLRSTLSETESRLKIAQAAPETTTAYVSDQFDSLNVLVDELRGPMTSITGYADFLLGESMGILGAMQRRFLERIKVSSERLEHLVDELQNTLEAEAGSDLQATRCDLNAVFDDAIGKVQPILSANQIALEVTIDDDLPEIVLDRQVLVNIVELLLQYAGSVTPKGSAILLSSQLQTSEGKEDYVLVQVNDSGTPIPLEELPYVFSPGRQSERAGSGQNGAATLVRIKRLVEHLGARIWVDSLPDKGSVFSLLLPVNRSLQSAEPLGDSSA